MRGVKEKPLSAFYYHRQGLQQGDKPQLPTNVRVPENLELRVLPARLRGGPFG